MKTTIPTSELKLGDHVDLEFYPYGSACVTRIDTDRDLLTLTRPYITFDHSSNVRYIGLEEFEIFWKKTDKTIVRVRG